jgi:hypothetical protein
MEANLGTSDVEESLENANCCSRTKDLCYIHRHYRCLSKPL